MAAEGPPLPGRLRAVAPAVSVGLGTALLVVTIRVWATSLAFVVGDPGASPVVQLGLLALVPFALAGASAPWAAGLGPRRSMLSAAVVVAGAVVALHATDGGGGQLAAATVAFTAALTWLVAVAAGAVDRHAAALGVVGGLALDAALHAVLRSTDLPWRDGALPWAATTALGVAFAVSAWASPAGRPRGPAWPWLAVGPAVVLHALVGNVSRVHATTGEAEWLAAAVVVGAHAAGVVAAVLAARRPSRGVGVAAALLTVGGLAAAVGPSMPFASTPTVVVGHVALAVGVALALAGVGGAVGHASAVRRGVAAAAGGVAIHVVALGYYGGFEVRLPVGRTALLAAAAVAVAAVAVLLRPGAPVRVRLVRPALALLAAAVAVPAAVAVAASPDPHAPPGAFPLRVATYNLRMGIDVDGRLDVAAAAEVIRGRRPDVVALQEVNRGWLIAGGADVLPRLAELVGMPYVFAPAADAVWGNAVLSRYPVADVRVDTLPEGDAAMRRNVLSLAVQLRGGRQLGVVATHLHHVAEDVELRRSQAERVAGVARGFTDSGIPVVVLGDLNAEPGDPELAPFSGLELATASLRAPPTFPSTDPRRLIDHVVVSPDLVASDLEVPRSTASDHLAVAVTVAPR